MRKELIKELKLVVAYFERERNAADKNKFKQLTVLRNSLCKAIFELE